MKDGFMRIAAVAPKQRPGDVRNCVDTILSTLKGLQSMRVELALFPELSLTGYTAADLFHNSRLLEDAVEGFNTLIDASRSLSTAFIVGLPIQTPTALYNAAALINGGDVQLTAKTYLPNYNEFYERRWFAPAPKQPIEVTVGGTKYTLTPSGVFEVKGALVGIEICEDLWVPLPPSTTLALAGADIVCNLSASNDLIGKHDYLHNLITGQSARLLCAYAYASAGAGESTTDLVFDPKAMIAENGTMLVESRRWQHNGTAQAIADVDIAALSRDRMHITTFNDCRERNGVQPVPTPKPDASGPDDLFFRNVNPHPFVPADNTDKDRRCGEIIEIQSSGLARRLEAIGCSHAVIGISGGLDSTLALLVTARAFNKLGLPLEGILGVTMPGFGTTGRTHNNAVKLMECLGVSSKEISIVPAVEQHFKDIDHNPELHDVTYENSQARQRTLLLMDLANQQNGIVVGTGDLSELALGWATYNGDHMSMYAVNAGVPKTLVKWLVQWFAEHTPDEELRQVLTDIINTPVSPELLPAEEDGTISQQTEHIVGPYELHDFFLYHTLRYGRKPEAILKLARKAFSPDQYSTEEISRWVDTFNRRFFTQQFKRSCLPDGPKVGSVCLSPRGDWRMPSDFPYIPWTLG